MNPNQVLIHYTLNLEQVNLIVSALAKLPFEQVEQFLVAFRAVALNTLKKAEEQAKTEAETAKVQAVPDEVLVEAGAE